MDLRLGAAVTAAASGDDLLTNSTVLLAFPHTILGAFTTAGMLVIGVSCVLLLRGRRTEVVSRSLRMAPPITLVAVLATMLFGDGQGRLMEKQQPMKMAAAEAIYNTQKGPGFSIFADAGLTRHPQQLTKDITIPHGLSLIADLSWNGTVKGINQINPAEQQKYGPGDYVPIVGVEYWTFRLMIGAGALMTLLTIVGLALMRRGRLERSRWFWKLAVIGIFLPILANWDRLGVHRGRAPAMGRLRPAEDLLRQLAQRLERQHRDHARGLCPDLRNPDRGRGLADVQRDPARSGARPGQRRGRRGAARVDRRPDLILAY